MCSLGLWGHSISIGYSASIKSSMKGRQRGDIPIPSNPITPRTPLPCPHLHHLPTPPSGATYPCPDHQVMKIDLCARGSGGTLRGPYCIGRHPLLSLTLLLLRCPLPAPVRETILPPGRRGLAVSESRSDCPVIHHVTLTPGAQ